MTEWEMEVGAFFPPNQQTGTTTLTHGEIFFWRAATLPCAVHSEPSSYGLIPTGLL
jgi:hypothetical protein